MNELDLFAAAIAIADQRERTSLLDRECTGRPEVRQRIDQLLDAHFHSHPLLDQTGPEATGAYVPNEEPGVVIAGRYKLLEQIGEGGMGTVWVAEQTQPVRRKVALKLIKAGMDSKSVIARFEAERQALAVMDHPNVAKVLDGGLTETGRPFFVMEYVKGVPITEYCDAARLSVPERLQLFTHVCQAVQHAHQKGIIHRDLKPSNILVAPYDDKPVPKIIDFGLAKAMHQSLTEKTLHTAHESVLGTPLYMSPEQAALNNLDVDTRSDVYSLGVVLYELLTGTTPLERKRFKEAAWDEMRRIIREEEPPRPSARLSSTDTLPSLAACRHTEPLKLTKQVRGELDWIVMKALEKDRARRYETANGFAADVLRYLSGEPVLAAPPSATYRLKKLVRRHRGPLMAASVVVLAVLVGAATVIAVQVRANRELAVKNGELADEQSKLEARNRELADEQAKVMARETQAINAVRRFGDVVSKNEALKNNPALESLRKELLKEPLAFFRDLRTRLQGDRDTRPESLERLSKATHDLSALTHEIGDLQDALTACREALEIDRKLADANPEIARYRGNLAASHHSVANLLSDTGKPAETEAEFRRAIALREKLADDYPDVAEYRSNLAGSRHGLGDVLAATGRPTEAEAEYRRAIALSQKVADENPADSRPRAFLASHHHNLGVFLHETGQSAKADGEYRRAKALLRKLADDHPADIEFRSCLADTHLAHANVMSVTVKPTEAEAETRKALAVYQQLADDHPSVTRFRSRVALGHYNLVGKLMLAGKTAEAETEYQLLLGMYRKLADDHPSVTEYRKHLSRTHQNLAILWKNTGNLAGAEVEFRAALAIMQKLADDNPTVTEYRSAVAGSHHGLGDILAATGRQAGAETEFRKAIALSQKATDENPASVQNRQFLANHHLNLGNMLAATSRPAEAEAEYRKAQAIYRKLVDAEPAVTEFANNLTLIHDNLGRHLLGIGRPAEAAAEFRKALELNPSFVEAKTGLAIAQRLTALLDKLPALLKGDYKPTTNDERLAFADACMIKKQYRASAGLYADAFAADPKLADDPKTGHRYNAACCASLAAGPGEDAAMLDDQERARLRKQAHDWLRADLAVLTKQLESGPPAARAAVAQQMKHWQQDLDLAGIRDADALARLPADEQKTFTQLWSDVAELLKKVEKK